MNEKDFDVEDKARIFLEEGLKKKPTMPAFRVIEGATGRMTKGDKLRARRARAAELAAKRAAKEG